MANPVFTRSRAFTDRTPAGYPNMPGYQVDGDETPLSPAEQHATYQPQDAAPQPFATTPSAASRPLTLDDVLIKTVITFGVLLVGGVMAWMAVGINPNTTSTLIIGGSLVAFVLALINSFKRKPSPVLILLYAFTEGLALGAISRIFSALAEGVVPKAILATIVTTLVMLVLFKTKIIRNSPTLMRIVFIGLGSIAAFYLLNFILTLAVPSWSFYGSDAPKLFGFPIWLIVSLVAIVLAALSLVTDFDFIVRAVNNGAPAETAWIAAFGLMVTLVWLYLEFLRIITYFVSSD